MGVAENVSISSLFFIFATNGLPKAWIWMKLREILTVRHGASICGHPGAWGGQKVEQTGPEKKRE